jgi:hypothetical protein
MADDSSPIVKNLKNTVKTRSTKTGARVLRDVVVGSHDLLVSLGQIAGVGGIALGGFVILFREFVKRTFFPTLDPEHAYRLLLLFMIFTFGVAVAGLAVWANRSAQGRVLAFVLLTFAVVLSALGFLVIKPPNTEAGAPNKTTENPKTESVSSASQPTVRPIIIQQPTPAAPSMDLPVIDVASAFVVYKGFHTDWDDSDAPLYKYYDATIVLSNAGQTAAKEVQYSYEATLFHWEEKEPTKWTRKFEPTTPPFTIGGEPHEITEDLTWTNFKMGSGKKEPKRLRSFLTIRYKDAANRSHQEQFCLQTSYLPDDEERKISLQKCLPDEVRLEKSY